MTQAAVTIQTLYWIFTGKFEEMVPGGQKMINKLNWWLLPIETGSTGIVVLLIIILIPQNWSEYLLILFIGMNLGVFYRDYYSIKWHLKKRKGLQVRL